MIVTPAKAGVHLMDSRFRGNDRAGREGANLKLTHYHRACALARAASAVIST